MLKYKNASLAIAVMWMSASIMASTLELYLQDLTSDNPQARAIARQMLPREGAAAVPKLLTILESDKMPIWRAAYNVLADIANSVTVPGKEKERISVTKALMTLVAADRPSTLKERGLRLLPLVVPEGYDVSPVASLLKDPEMREKARAALVEIGTTEAARALANALTDADSEFAKALLNALGAVRNRESMVQARLMLTHQDAGIRAAALRAVAWTGDPGLVASGRTVFSTADNATHWEAGDAFLRLADAILKNGGNYDIGMSIYREVYDKSKDATLQAAALAGMGRHGDETVVPVILKALQNPNRKELEGPVFVALGALQGPSPNQAMADAYSSLDAEARITALGVFGKRQDAVFIPILSDALRSNDATAHRLASLALADSELPEAVSLLASDAKSCTDERKTDSLAGLQHLADVMRAKNNRTGAGEAFFGLYQAADSDELRAAALEGIKIYPVPASMDLLLSQSQESDLTDPAQLQSTLDIVKGLHGAGRLEEAKKILGKVLPRISSPEMIRDAIPILASLGTPSDCAKRFGFVTDWMVVGGFSWDMADGFTKTPVNEPQVDVSAKYKIGDREVAWAAYSSQDPGGTIDLTAAIGGMNHVSGYAWTRISVPEATEAMLKVGSDDGIKVWVNGEPVHENNIDRGAQIDQDQVPIQFKAGENTLLICVTQGGGGWNAIVRLTDKDGAPLSFTIVK